MQSACGTVPDQPPADDSGPLLAALALNRVPGLTQRSRAQLWRSAGSPLALLERGRFPDRTPPKALALLRRLRRSEAREELVRADLRWLCGAPNRVALYPGHPLYPLLLLQIADPPTLLFVSGDAELLGRPQVAVVGSRRASIGGRHLARALAADLARAGFAVTSGLARGIDAAAHRGALDAGGTTMAVMATGPDQVYPPEHRELAQSISASGALASEYPVGTSPRRWSFPGRNRLLSGLALGVAVVEAGRGSGSLITASFALEQGREVFAVPGLVQNQQYTGCHELIRDGATLIESAVHIMEQLGPLAGLSEVPSLPQVPNPELSPEAAVLLKSIDEGLVTFEQLLDAGMLNAGELMVLLHELEVAELLVFAGGTYQRLGRL